ncbi:DUF2264 domain-containing protein [Saliterribacillus persicus]|uniref:DUF2264 domain-containing protein n=1 Tax=Saliterribacillus persicus TaxID=930114 RepID=A0A368XP97_9BACI|nr:DUF2264 domain-containing protein [Saliterribacillus persicus]RCW69783.1 hypothetical protein DFR57_107173 [Saliterribacillus persicus]
MENTVRKFWLKCLLRIADPVIEALEKEELKILMPVEANNSDDRAKYTHLEAFGRLLAGIAPWLEHKKTDEKEEKLRITYATRIRKCIDHATNPSSADYMNFHEGHQPIVDTAFFAQGLLRAPNELWEKLDDRVKENVVTRFKATRSRKPHFSNWLLFSAIIEGFLYKIGEKDWDAMRIDYAFNQLEQWYLGDGIYSDGVHFHHDYYNSFVIFPMLVDLLELVGKEDAKWIEMEKKVEERAKRYAAVQERLISPEGTYPPIGRSLAYRFGAFHHLSNQVYLEKLPSELLPGQVRSALSAVLKRTIEMPGTFDEKGWLTIGFNGHQPSIGEGYISTGSLYLCTTLFLPLGLSSEAKFWQEQEQAWTSKKAWAGEEFNIDSAMPE